MAAIGSRAGWWPEVLALAVCALAASSIIALVAWGSADPSLQLFGPAVLRGDANSGTTALTFDDGPHPESTPALLETLRRADARATFFLLVDQAEAHPALARAIAAEHEIGLHGLTHHPWLTLRSPTAGAAELREARERLEAVVGQPVRLYRPPFGAVSPRLLRSADDAGLVFIWCSVRTRDGGRMDADTVVQRCQAVSAGDIVLLHEGRPSTRDAMPRVLSDLADRGLRSVTVGTLCPSV